MPNPDRAIAKGNPFYLILVDFFGDDVSGNRTKSWNKHWNTYMTNRNLPRRLLQQEFHTHFISTSPSASVTEQFHAFKTIIECVSKLFRPSNAPLISLSSDRHIKILWLSLMLRQTKMSASSCPLTPVHLTIRCRARYRAT
jgi:hypothetical protein